MTGVDTPDELTSDEFSRLIDVLDYAEDNAVTGTEKHFIRELKMKFIRTADQDTHD